MHKLYKRQQFYIKVSSDGETAFSPSHAKSPREEFCLQYKIQRLLIHIHEMHSFASFAEFTCRIENALVHPASLLPLLMGP